MPYPTFFHLSADKRKRVMDAVWQEFTTFSYMDVSINRIVQNAGISRGSFYQYFSGKPDLFSYVLHTIFESAKKMFLAQLTAHNNDLFFAILGMYDTILWTNGRSRSPDQQRIHTMIQLNSDLDMSQFTIKLDCDSIARNLQELLEPCGYHLETAQECFALLHMLAAITTTSLADTMRHPQNEEKNHAILEQQLVLIRRGLAAGSQ